MGKGSFYSGAAMPFSRPAAGQYTRGPQLPATATTFNNGHLRLVPWFLPGVRIDQLEAEVTVVGGTGSVHRIVAYSDNGSLYPAALLFDSGAIDTTVLGVKPAAWAATLPNVIWVGAVQQGAPTPSATLRTVQNPGGYELRGTSFNDIASNNGTGYVAAGVTAAPPSTFPANQSIAFNAPIVAARAA